MEITAQQIRSYRLGVHGLDKKAPLDRLIDAAGVCGVQNTPPGAWETSMWNRLEGCTVEALDDALYREKTLLQAWSFRGVPVVFPAEESGVFLTPLAAEANEQPWIYTQGITGALDHIGMTFDDLLARLRNAIAYLDDHTVTSKEALDRVLAARVGEGLPANKRALWEDPSMYGSPDKQTVGGAAVSFLLRPCSFMSLIVFGRRQDISPTFTSYKNWLGREPVNRPDGDKALVRKFLHAYGPATVNSFMNWLGCSPKQGRRLWNTVVDEMTPVQVGDRTCFMLSADIDSLVHAEAADATRLWLLGAHDPYLDLRDRTVILQDTSRHKAVWRYVANPGVVLRGGCVVGTWKTKTLGSKMDINLQLWEGFTATERRTLADLAEGYAALRLRSVRHVTLEGA